VGEIPKVYRFFFDWLEVVKFLREYLMSIYGSTFNKFHLNLILPLFIRRILY